MEKLFNGSLFGFNMCSGEDQMFSLAEDQVDSQMRVHRGNGEIRKLQEQMYLNTKSTTI